MACMMNKAWFPSFFLSFLAKYILSNTILHFPFCLHGEQSIILYFGLLFSLVNSAIIHVKCPFLDRNKPKKANLLQTNCIIYEWSAMRDNKCPQL